MLLLEINMNWNVELEYSQPLLITRYVSVKYPLNNSGSWFVISAAGKRQKFMIF